MNEDLRLLHLHSRIVEFTNIPQEYGIYYVILEGPVRVLRTETQVAAAIFPSVSDAEAPWSVIISVTGEGARAMPKYQSKLLQLQVSERIKGFGLLDDAPTRRAYTGECRRQGLPIITICFAQYAETKEEVVFLNAIQGISPESALKLFHDKAIERLSKLS